MPTVTKTRRPWVAEKPKAETNQSWGGNEHSKFYNLTQWRTIRRLHIEGEPLCRHCKEKGRLTPATDVDHIVPIKQGGDSIASDNLQSLCVSCHRAKNAADNVKYGKGGGV